MRHVERSFLLDYGDLVIRVRYLSASRLEWVQVKGPEAGSTGEEKYSCAEIRDDLVFFWWQEKASSVVAQVVDFEGGHVYTTWASADGVLSAFRGVVTPTE